MLSLTHRENVARYLKRVIFPSPYKKNVPLCLVCEILSWQHGINIPFVLQKKWDLCRLAEIRRRVTKEMIFGSHGRNTFLVLQEKWFFIHMAEMCPSVTKEMPFGPHGRSALLVLEEKCYFGHIARTFPSCCERNVISVTWQIRYILVPKVAVYSPHATYIADIWLCIGSVPSVFFLC